MSRCDAMYEPTFELPCDDDFLGPQRSEALARFICTLPRGHAGDHIAHGLNYEVIDTWHRGEGKQDGQL